MLVIISKTKQIELKDLGECLILEIELIQSQNLQNLNLIIDPRNASITTSSNVENRYITNNVILDAYYIAFYIDDQSHIVVNAI